MVSTSDTKKKKKISSSRNNSSVKSKNVKARLTALGERSKGKIKRKIPGEKPRKTARAIKKENRVKRVNAKFHGEGDKSLSTEATAVNKLSKVGILPLDDSPADQSKWLWDQFKSFFGSSVSTLEDSAFPENACLDLGNSTSSRLERVVSHTRLNLVPSEGSGAGPRNPGSPTVLIVSSSAIRCTDVLRAFKDMNLKFGSAKLFAKHFKIESQIDFLKKPIFVAAGTPARTQRLVTLGHLGLQSLQLLVIDLHRNAKGVTLLDIPETRNDFWEFYRLQLHDLVLKESLKVCLLG